jgi:hypothetical protein
MVMDVSRLRTLGWPATTDFEAGVRKHTNGTLPTWHECALFDYFEASVSK